MNFNRYKCQEFMEAEVGCTDPSNLGDFKDDILEYTLSTDKSELLTVAIVEDAISLHYKASLSFIEAIYGIINGLSSWAIVKLYYSTFYSLRCKLLVNNFAPIKDGKGNIYFLKCEPGKSPQKIPGKERGDHKITIKAFKHLMPEHKLNGNTMDGDGVSVFSWLMDYRELVNYRIDSFIEPEFGYNVIPNIIGGSEDFDNIVLNYIEDENLLYCFLSDHSIIATPLTLINESTLDLSIATNNFHMTQDKLSVISNIIDKSGLTGSIVMNRVFMGEVNE